MTIVRFEGAAPAGPGTKSQPVDDFPIGPVLSPADVRWLAPACEHRHLEAAHCLFREGLVPEAVYILRQGIVSLSRRLRERRVTLALLREGSIVGDVPLLARSPSAYDAFTVTAAEVLVLPTAQFFAALHDVPAFASRWTLWSVRRLGMLERRVADLLAGDLQAQVASLLLHELVQSDPIELTQQAIADLLGVQRTSVSRVLHELARRGVISVGYGHISVLNRRALASVGFGRSGQMEATSA